MRKCGIRRHARVAATRPEVCVLAGGLSLRLGRDKARLRLGGRTLVGHLRARARSLGWPMRVIRRDLVPRCGPLGGVYTALKTSRAELVVFLACDMPLVSADLLRRMRRRLAAGGSGLWVQQGGVVGFPFCLRRRVLPEVEQLLARGEFSLQALARAAGARSLVPSPAEAASLVNINTREDWESARAFWRQQQRRPAPRQTGARRRRQGRG